ncbi:MULTISPECIES: 16S rRNA (cytosine(1402)-N(4))-methyltransferase RsmH [unclassified Bosea (in: a-proteobacteria)]|uniref:16S rRNA (cytosine(1402)-N(4))-methyltransferase RsmH n=1 Tax=unclassified Bosea (in: a-proteobacteria) TaxID=2653178 RepID=UPI000F753305|nr:MULTISPECIES: 16S rRNA (cytosine(1402)-N(4))-methyltransferase RsmH [unclassified Bosea (in: a-proteobacteria)]AZO76380.1 16S rRNA (cytosine(1402)-N(4))-methyltransferase [Bosea sp. Tri-49]RXT26307.1 16S rRNA (cytosine(1402)-N(4))-methyltransferase [Bosea sp. Tri-39]RXT31548.1 16S rRNA (cytosine(1402)-N(4))-methyltransferase [Bosea sp. Tri-54]
MTGESHIPVLMDEALDALALKPGGRYLDGTFGAGGYSRALLEREPEATLLALDRDPTAIAGGADLVLAMGGRLTLAEARFGALAEEAERFQMVPLDGVVLDIGVSSMQLDQAERGFSFRFDGPLDMRMGASGQSAAELVNEADEGVLANIIYHYGEERRSRAVARAIVEARRKAPITTTKQLADLVAGIVRGEPGGAHPATRTFQGLRIAVNDELGELVRALHGAEAVLKPGGRLSVVTFHSLEDRIVKQFFAERSGKAPTGSRHAPAVAQPQATFSLVIKGPVAPSVAETRANPRARSAKLRAVERTDLPPRAPDPDLVGLAVVPAPQARRRS